MENNQTKKSQSFIGGGMIIAGTAVGAGMFGLPTASAGMWSMWAIFALMLTWFCMAHSGFMILETNLNYPVGSSFNTIVKDTLGNGWNIFNGLTVVFVGYILAYAYISGGGSVVAEMFGQFGLFDNPVVMGILTKFGFPGHSEVMEVAGQLGLANSSEYSMYEAITAIKGEITAIEKASGSTPEALTSTGYLLGKDLVKSFEFFQKIIGSVFAISLALIVWISTKLVDRLTTVLIGGMIITFFMSISGLTLDIKFDYLFNTVATEKVIYFPFIFAALPVLLTSFGYHHSVPSLMKYYGKDPKKIVTCILFGTILALSLYILWILAILGNLPRSEFVSVSQQGGNIGVLVAAVNNAMDTDLMKTLLSVFATAAVASSFLGVTLGLFDYLADLLKFEDTRLGRTKTAAILYIPPFIGGIFFPNGFYAAIGYAGLAATVWAAIVPALMAKASREKFGNTQFRTWGGNILIYVIIAYGLIIATCHILAMFGLLPELGK